MSPEEIVTIIEDWKKNVLHPMMEEFNVPPERCYNADQTGLFYQKLPNTLYVDKDTKKKPGGSKQMKSKERITLMVCTAASGDKVPLAMVGKAKKPECFKMCTGHIPPMAYTHSSKGWFTRGVTKWWILEVLIPHHQEKMGK